MADIRRLLQREPKDLRQRPIAGRKMAGKYLFDADLRIKRVILRKHVADMLADVILAHCVTKPVNRGRWNNAAGYVVRIPVIIQMQLPLLEREAVPELILNVELVVGLCLLAEHRSRCERIDVSSNQRNGDR